MEMIRRRLLVVPLLALVLVISGCPKDPYTASMAGSDDVANVVGDAIMVIGQLQTDKLVSPNEVQALATRLNTVVTLNQQFRADVRQIHNTTPSAGKSAYINAAQVFVTNVNNTQFLQTVGVRDPVAQAKVQTVLLAIQTALNGIQTAINNAKGVK